MDVAIIGAGVGGLAAAITLAAGGVRVTIHEKNGRVGGKLGTWSSGGFTFDTGPHVLTMPWTLMELLRRAEPRGGKDLFEALELIKLDTICRYHFPDGDILDAPADAGAARGAIARFAPGEEQGFEAFLRYARRVSDATTEPFLKQDFSAGIRGAPTGEQWSQLRGFLALRPWRTLRDVVREHFRDERIRQVFELYALYSGSHPARCPGIYATVADVQWRQGTFYIPGGLFRLAEMLRDTAVTLGVRFEFDCPVEQIIVKRGRARGIATRRGERIYADTVVCNADCLAASQSLIPGGLRRSFSDARIERIDPSTSAFLLLLGIKGHYPQLAHHNSFLSANPESEYAAIFDARRPAADPTVGIACQSVTDSARAPAGHSNLFVMTNPPALSSAFNWAAEAPRYRGIVLDKLESMGLDRLRNRIVVEQMWTPLDLERRYGAYRGTIYGPSGNGWRNAFLRPPNASQDIRALYFAGGSTHPGGGIPLCILSGMTVGKAILGD